MCLLTKQKIMCLKKIHVLLSMRIKPHSSEGKHALVYHYVRLAIDKTS